MSIDTEEDDRPRKKKKKKKKAANVPWLLIGIGGGVLALLLIVGGGLLIWKPWKGAEQKVVAQNPPPPMPQPQPGNQGAGLVREPKTTLGTIRARGAQIERDNEMKQIQLFFDQYCDIAKNPNTRTLDGFLDFFKRDSNKIYSAFKEEKTYAANVRARVGSEDILAYETEIYTTGYYTIRANGQLGFVSAEELKAAVK